MKKVSDFTIDIRNKFFNKEHLLFLFHYNKEEGKLFWKNPPKSMIRLKGKEAGCVTVLWKKKVRRIHTQDLIIGSHTIIFFLEHNFYAPFIFHLDGNGLNNHISNLKFDASNNTKGKPKKEKKPYVPGRNLKKNISGTCFDKTSNKWMARTRFDGKTKYLGWYKTRQEAYERYVSELKNRGEIIHEL